MGRGIAEQLRLGLEIMERHRETFAALARESDAEDVEKPNPKSVIPGKDRS